MTPVIRQAELKDVISMGAAERDIAQEPGFFCSQPNELSDKSIADLIVSFEKNKNGIYLVAENNNEIIGHAFLEISPLRNLQHTAELNIIVHNGWQNKHVGTKLLERLVEWAKVSGLEQIQLYVRATNHPAIFLYKKFGFEEVARLKNKLKINDDFYIDDIFMTLFLSN